MVGGGPTGSPRTERDKVVKPTKPKPISLTPRRPEWSPEEKSMDRVLQWVAETEEARVAEKVRAELHRIVHADPRLTVISDALASGRALDYEMILELLAPLTALERENNMLRAEVEAYGMRLDEARARDPQADNLRFCTACQVSFSTDEGIRGHVEDHNGLGDRRDLRAKPELLRRNVLRSVQGSLPGRRAR